MDSKARDKGLLKAIKYFKGVTGLADALGIKSQAVSQWVVVPKGRAFQIEVFTQGKLKAKELNPKARV